mmetsp:Transcript_60589/g.106167  ORF Transcript_60589/g.106167 Transcript_60589/m.106167 type:complete len:156 (+) Transcript_60589:63-530(+)
MADASFFRFFFLKALTWLWFPYILLSVRPLEEHQDELAVTVDHRGRQEKARGHDNVTMAARRFPEDNDTATDQERPLGHEDGFDDDVDQHKLKASKQRIMHEKEEDVDDFDSVTSNEKVRRAFDCRDACPAGGSCQPLWTYPNMDKTHPYNILCG